MRRISGRTTAGCQAESGRSAVLRFSRARCLVVGPDSSARRDPRGFTRSPFLARGVLPGKPKWPRFGRYSTRSAVLLHALAKKARTYVGGPVAHWRQRIAEMLASRAVTGPGHACGRCLPRAAAAAYIGHRPARYVAAMLFESFGFFIIITASSSIVSRGPTRFQTTTPSRLKLKP